MNELTMRSKEKLKDTLRQMKMKAQQSMGHWGSNPKREIRSNTDQCQETRKISNNLTLHLKELEKE